MKDTARASRQSLDAYRGTRVVVLGATGFVGSWVAQALVRQGAHVHLLVRNPVAGARMLDWIGGDTVVKACDIADFAALRDAITMIRPAVTFNLAGYGVDAVERDEAVMRRINAEVVAELAGILVEHRDPDWRGQALVHAGTSAEYGQPAGPVTEQTPTSPLTAYGRTKLAGTESLAAICAETGLPAVTARLFMVYGAGEHPHRLFPSLMRAAATGEAIELSAGRQRLDFTYVGDVADGLLRLGTCIATPGTVINLATGRLTAVRSFVVTAAELLGLRADQLRFGEAAARPDDVRYGTVSTARLLDSTDWVPPTNIAAGIRMTLELQAWNHATTG